MDYFSYYVPYLSFVTIFHCFFPASGLLGYGSSLLLEHSPAAQPGADEPLLQVQGHRLQLPL